MIRKINFLVVALAVVSQSAFAEIPAPGKLSVGGVSLNAFVDSNYMYNFNKPSNSLDTILTGQNSYRAYDRAHHQFTLNQARVGMSGKSGATAFDLQLGFGSQLSVLNTVDGAVDTTFQNVRRATVSHNLGGVTFTLGRMDANFGLERIDSIDNWNYGRSMAFATMNPKFYNGLKAGYEMGAWDFSVGVANGADRTIDNNRGKTFSAAVNYGAGAKTSVGVNYVAGSEKASDSLKWRHHFGLNAKHAYSDKFALALDGTFVTGMDEALSTNTAVTNVRGTARRYSAALYGNASFLSKHWNTLRFEWLRDEDGAITRMRQSNTFFNTTLTHRYTVTENLSYWAEVRWDHANRNAFYNQSANLQRDNQVTILVAGTFHI